MKEQGYKLVAVWLDKTEQGQLDAAAAAHELPLSTYIRNAAFWVAVKHPAVRPPKTNSSEYQ